MGVETYIVYDDLWVSPRGTLNTGVPKTRKGEWE